MLILSIALGLAADPLQGRTAYSLSYGWNFELAQSDKNCSFPDSLNGKRCFNLQHQLEVAKKEDCPDTCCSLPFCNVWQWSDSSGCWTGNNYNYTDSCSSDKSWSGGGHAPVIKKTVKPGEKCPNGTWCDPELDSSSWRKVTIPHDFVVEGNFSQESGDRSHGYLPFANGHYRKIINIPNSAKGQHVTLDFEAAQTHTVVYLNGVAIGSNGYGYTPFSFDLSLPNVSSLINYGGDNELAVGVTSDADSWWYDGGGLYRPVWLTITPPLHFERFGIYAPSVVIGNISSDGKTAPAALYPSIEIIGEPNHDVNFTLTSTVFYDAKQIAQQISKGKTVNGYAVVNQTISLGTADLWAPEHPNLYTLETSVVPVSGTVADIVNTTFGVRKIYYDANKGFFLNDKSVKIKGTANHQDFAGLGVAVPETLQDYRISALQAFGVNGWRCAHNAHSDAFMNAADRLGMLVWAENHRNGQVDAAEILVRRDRNHPSVIIWSICNEVLCSSSNSLSDAHKIKDVYYKYDFIQTRSVSANQNGWNNPDSVLDILGIDYSTESYDKIHAKAPKKPLISSETSSAVSDRGEYVNDGYQYVSGYDTNKPGWGETAQVAWGKNGILDKDFIIGGWTWTGWDYKGEPTPYSWPNINSHFGILDIAGFWKDRTYWYAAAYKPDVPLVHVFPHWSWAVGEPVSGSRQNCTHSDNQGCIVTKSGADILIWAYGNGEEAELIVNGNSLGRQDLAQWSHVSWTVPYKPGSVEARVYAKKGDKTPSATDKVETVNDAKSLSISTGFIPTGGLPANGVEVAVLYVSVVDDKGRVLPAAENLVTFTVSSGEGAIIGTGNGDPSSHVPDHSPVRPAWHGKVMGLVAAADGFSSDSIVVTASAEGLQSATIKIPVRPANGPPRL